MATRLRGWRRHVHCRTTLEESVRTEVESEHRHGHYGPVLGTRHVIVREDVPQRELRVIDLSIRLGPVRETISSRMLIRIFSGRESLLRVGGRNTDMIRCDS